MKARSLVLSGRTVMVVKTVLAVVGLAAVAVLLFAGVTPVGAGIIGAWLGIALVLFWFSPWRGHSHTGGARSKPAFALGQTTASRRFGWRGMERLEPRQMLAGYELSDYIPYILDDDDKDIGGLLGDLKNISGAAYIPDSSPERFFSISNNPEEIYEFQLNGNNPPTLLRTIDLDGFDDTEGIVYLGDDGLGGELFAIVEEGIGHISIRTITPTTTTLSKASAAAIIPSPNPVEEGEDGYEGIAFRPDPFYSPNDLFYVAKEKTDDLGDLGLWQVDRNGDATLIDIRDSAGTPIASLVPNISDIYFADFSGTPTVFLLSQSRDDPEEIRRVELSEGGGTVTGTIVETLDMSTLIPSGQTFPNPEGIAFSPNGSDMFITSEPNLFYQFRLGGDANRDGTVDRADLAALSSGYGKLTGATWEEGDFSGAADRTGDGAVNLSDLAILRRQFAKGGAGPAMSGGGTVQAPAGNESTLTSSLSYVGSVDSLGNPVTVDITDPATNDPSYVHEIEVRIQLDSLASDVSLASMALDIGLGSGLSEQSGWKPASEGLVGSFLPTENLSTENLFYQRSDGIGSAGNDLQSILLEVTSLAASNLLYSETPRLEAGHADVLGYPTHIGSIFVQWDGSVTQIDLLRGDDAYWRTYRNNNRDGDSTTNETGFIGATLVFGGG